MHHKREKYYVFHIILEIDTRTACWTGKYIAIYDASDPNGPRLQYCCDLSSFFEMVMCEAEPCTCFLISWNIFYQSHNLNNFTLLKKFRKILASFDALFLHGSLPVDIKPAAGPAPLPY